VLDVVAVDASLDGARRQAYEAAAMITWDGMQYRTDIAR
jgi:phosphoribosylamine-glycine ligase